MRTELIPCYSSDAFKWGTKDHYKIGVALADEVDSFCEAEPIVCAGGGNFAVRSTKTNDLAFFHAMGITVDGQLYTTRIGAGGHRVDILIYDNLS